MPEDKTTEEKGEAQESQEEEAQEEQTREEESGEDKNSSQEADKQEQEKGEQEGDEKEHNRKGYQIRKAKENEDKVSRDEFEQVNQKVSAMEAENEKLKFQKAHPEITDEMYQSLDAQAKGIGKTKEQILEEDPVWKNYLETQSASQRVEEAETTPSTRTKPGSSGKSAWEMSDDEFKQKQNEVLSM